jgi:TolB-like protein/tetratricopeptide (TPR) repeat protein
LLIGRYRIANHNHLNSVVILPFQNMTGDPQKEYLADGITEQLTDSLAHIPDLRVVARTSAFQFKGKAIDVREIGQRLNADAVVEGSLRSINGRLLLTVQVNRSRDGYHIVSQTFEGAPQELERLESDSVSPVRAAVRPGARAANRKTVDPEAYDLFLKARARRAEGTRDAFEQALIYLNQAIRRDPTYADAYAALAGAYAAAAVDFAAQPLDYAEKAKATAGTALRLDPRSAQAYAAQGLVDSAVFLDWKGGEQELRRAIQFMPQNASAHNWLDVVLLAQGRFAEARAEARTAANLDPLSPVGVSVGLTYYMARQYDQALSEFIRARYLHPEVVAIHLFVGTAWEAKGQFEKAMAEYQLCLPKMPETKTNLAHLLAVMGKRSEARRMLAEIEQAGPGQVFNAFDIACVYAALADREHAFQWLERAVDDRAVWALKVNPMLDPLRNDPRFAQLLKRAGLAG